MSTRQGPVHVATTRRSYRGKTYCTHLLRRTYREDGKVKNETVGNLSHLPEAVIELIRRALRGETLVSPAEGFEIVASRAHGDAAAVLTAIGHLKLRELFGTRRCREADLVIGMIAARVLAPHTKLATTRWWHTRTLAEDLGIAQASEDELYAAMDWLLGRQAGIENKLAARHLGHGSLALYDLSSSYFEGTHCPLAKLGYSRDGKRNKPQVNYGLLTDRRGCPVAVSVYPGNVGDASTLLPQVMKLKTEFGLDEVVLIGDRGMIGQASIETLRHTGGLNWITAANGWSRAAIRSSRGCAPTSAPPCWRRPKANWARCARWSSAAAWARRPPSACASGGSSTNTRWPSTSCSRSRIGTSPGSATVPRSRWRPPSTGCT